MSNEENSQEPMLVSYSILHDDLPVTVVPASEAWRIGLSAADVRWLLGIPEPPRKPPSYKQLVKRCKRQGCEWTPGLVDGWEFCRVHSVTRRKTTNNEQA